MKIRIESEFEWIVAGQGWFLVLKDSDAININIAFIDTDFNWWVYKSLTGKKCKKSKSSSLEEAQEAIKNTFSKYGMLIW